MNQTSEVTVHYTAPETMGASGGFLDGVHVHLVGSLDDLSLGECPICLDTMAHAANDNESSTDNAIEETGNLVVKIVKCGHHFHRACLENAMKNHKPVCPVCRKPVREPQGSCPSGTMTVRLRSGQSCPGFYNNDGSPVDSICIKYSISSGIQKSYHYHPGQTFSGAHRVAYLPHTNEGLQLLSRLVYAWQHGLIFTVGTSLTTHQTNTVVWSSIHHKTSLHGGPHGFPDAGYIMNCNESLDALYVPDSEFCGQATSQIFAAALPSSPREVQNGHANGNSVVPTAPMVHSRSRRFISRVVGSRFRRFIFSNTTINYEAPQNACGARPTGSCPSGTMSVSLLQGCPCPGFSNSSGNPVDTLCIDYAIPGGIQTVNHANPGHSYRGTTRRAYVPDMDEGHQLLIRLMHSWKRGFNLSVGTSLTTREQNVVVWSQLVPHKTSLHGGQWGFPDVNYINDCNKSLDQLNVPKANECLDGNAGSTTGQPNQKKARV